MNFAPSPPEFHSFAHKTSSPLIPSSQVPLEISWTLQTSSLSSCSPISPQHFHSDCQSPQVSTSSPKNPRGRRQTRRKSPTVVLRQKRVRRMKANDRERTRMHLLNEALERLRLALPPMGQEERLTKIETLRFAHNYIFALTQTVQVIRNLRRNGGTEATPDFGQCGCDVETTEEGTYIVRAGNVRILLDAEGQLMDTLATRPATPPPSPSPHNSGPPQSPHFPYHHPQQPLYCNSPPYNSDQQVMIHSPDEWPPNAYHPAGHVPLQLPYTPTDDSNTSFNSSYADDSHLHHQNIHQHSSSSFTPPYY